MRKIYCKNCKYKKITMDDCFGGGGELYCCRPTGKIIKDYIDGDYKQYKICYVEDKCYPNKRDTNGCKFYKRKWYKFWIKDREIGLPNISSYPPMPKIKDAR